MNIGIIPPELLMICTPVVKQFHQKNGFSDLSTKITTGGSMDAITSIPETSAVLNANNQYYKIRKWCFLASIGIVCLSVFVPWWSFLALVMMFLADRFLAYRAKDGWKYLSSVLLSLEMLTNDFAGWGKAYPQERTEALGVLKDNPASPKSIWIDYYLPQRAELDPSLLKAYEPVMPSQTAQDI